MPELCFQVPQHRRFLYIKEILQLPSFLCTSVVLFTIEVYIYVRARNLGYLSRKPSLTFILTILAMQNISEGDRPFMLSVSEHPWNSSGFWKY